MNAQIAFWKTRALKAEAELATIAAVQQALDQARAEAAIPRCTCCGTTEDLHEDYGSGGPYRCGSRNCVVF
jgi:hypothetical protein